MSTAKKTGTAPKSGPQRRNRRKKNQSSCIEDTTKIVNIEAESKPKKEVLHLHKELLADQENSDTCNCPECSIVKIDIGTMTNDPVESREKVKAAREAKKLAKQQAKMKRDAALDIKQPTKAQAEVKNENSSKELPEEVIKGDDSNEKAKELKNKVVDEYLLLEQTNETKSKVGPKDMPGEVLSEDEVDRAASPVKTVGTVLKEIEPAKEQVKAERAAKKAAKQAKKKDTASGDVSSVPPATITPKAGSEMTVRDVIETLRDIKNVAQEVKEVTAQVQALNLDKKKPEKVASAPKSNVQAQSSVTKHKEGPPSDVKPKGSVQTEDGGKSKAELKAERRAKQEAQRAAKEASTQAKTVAPKTKEPNTQPSKEVSKAVVAKEKSPKPKTLKQTAKPQGHKVSWFRHLYNDDHKEKLNSIPINSNLHPAIIKLGVQLATRVVAGSNARSSGIALPELFQMVRDYSLPARTEVARGLEAQLAASLRFLWAARQPAASQTNAVKFLRHHLAQLPNNVDEFDAKKTLQEEIDRYIREQIDMAGEAISIAVRNKICEGDNILTYGCSSLIERILVDAHRAGVQFRAVVCGGGAATRAAREMTRRLTARGVRCICVDITALSFVMRTVQKVVLGCSALLADGAVLGAAGSATVALAARAGNTPVLVACETHKVSERVQVDAFVYNEIGDPDDLIDKSDENSPLKDWRSNPNLTPLNLTYDVTPPNLVTAVVTELAILPCTSAPVVLRFKLSEYSV